MQHHKAENGSGKVQGAQQRVSGVDSACWSLFYIYIYITETYHVSIIYCIYLYIPPGFVEIGLLKVVAQDVFKVLEDSSFMCSVLVLCELHIFICRCGYLYIHSFIASNA